MSYFDLRTPDRETWIRLESQLHNIIAAVIAGHTIARKEFLRFLHENYAHLRLFPITVEHGDYGFSNDLEEWIRWLGYDDLNIRETCARMLWNDLSFADFIRYLYKFKFRSIDRSFPIFIHLPLSDKEAAQIQDETQVAVCEAQRILLIRRNPEELAFEFEVSLRARKNLVCGELLALLYSDPSSEEVKRLNHIGVFTESVMLCKLYFKNRVTPTELSQFRHLGLGVLDWEIYKLNKTSDEPISLGFTPNVDVQFARGNLVDSLVQGSVFAMLQLTRELMGEDYNVACMINAIEDCMECVLANDRPKVTQTLFELRLDDTE